MTTPVDSPGHAVGSMLGSAAWGRANGGRMTLAQQCRYALQTVVAQLRVQGHDRGAVSDDRRQGWSRIDSASRQAVLTRHPQTGFAQQMSEAMRQQAERAPHTRTRLLWRMGFERAIRRSAWRE